MPHKKFEIPEPNDDDPITFEVGGRKFQCLPRIPVGTRLLMRGQGVITKGDTVPFIRGCLVVEDRGQWDEVVVDPTVLMDAKTVEDIFWFLIEEYAAREGERLIERLPETGQ